MAAWRSAEQIREKDARQKAERMRRHFATLSKPQKQPRPHREHQPREISTSIDLWRAEMLAADNSDCCPWVSVDDNIDAEFREMFRNA